MRRTCDVCTRPYQAKRATSRYCSPRCRVRASRGAKVVRPIERPLRELLPDASVAQATRAELDRLGAADSLMGSIALTLAAKIDAASVFDGSLVSMVKELRIVMADATRTARIPDDPIDELKARRDRKRRSVT